ncbi:MAG: dihydrodipicolinate synthase family protein [Anaerolineae bacterium]|nr:dihydrodipicolinate synthase family protein [Anaerolineae bacterium]
MGDHKKRKEQLTGIVTPLPTFFDSDYKIQANKMKKHVRWLIDNGIANGTGVLMAHAGLSEAYLMDESEFQCLAQTLAEAADGKVPTMVGLFEMSARVAARKAAYAQKAGIDFVQVAPPHYFVPSEEDVYGHYRYITDHVDIGIMIYNTPWAMPQPGFDMSIPLLERLCELDNIIGMKWHSFDVNHFVHVMRLFSDRLNLIDNLRVISLGPRLGMKGFIEWWTNAAPRWSLKRLELMRAKKWEEYDEFVLKYQTDPFIRTAQPEQLSWVGMGEGPTARLTLKILGLDAGPALPAQAPLSPTYEQAFRNAMTSSDILDYADWKPSIVA